MSIKYLIPSLCEIRNEKCCAPRKATIITKLIIVQMEMKSLAWAIIVSNTLLENLQPLLSCSFPVPFLLSRIRVFHTGFPEKSANN